MSKGIEAIRQALGGLSDEELGLAGKLVSEEWKRRQAAQAMQFRPGERVSFLGRNGVKLTGSVEYANLRTVAVMVKGERWRVSPGLLERAA
jgi:hypothetical protein